MFCPLEKTQIFFSMPSIWSAIYKKDFLEKNEIKFLETPGASYQDTSFNFKVWSKAKSVYLIEDAFLHYRQDNENSSVKSPGKIYCVCDEWNEIERYIKEHNLFDKLNSVFVSLKYGTYMWNLNRLAYPLNWQFMQTFHKEFKDLKQNGNLPKDLFKCKNMSLLIKSKYIFYINMYLNSIFRNFRHFMFCSKRHNDKFLFQFLGIQITNYDNKNPYLISFRI